MHMALSFLRCMSQVCLYLDEYFLACVCMIPWYLHVTRCILVSFWAQLHVALCIYLCVFPVNPQEPNSPYHYAFL